MHSCRNICVYVLFVIIYFRNVEKQCIFQQKRKFLRDLTSLKHKPDEWFFSLSGARSEVLLFCMERERKKEIGVDWGLKNLEWPVKSSYWWKLKATLVKMNYMSYLLYCTLFNSGLQSILWDKYLNTDDLQKECNIYPNKNNILNYIYC